MKTEEKKGFIDPTALVHPTAKVHPTVTIGANTIIGANVSIGANTEISKNVKILAGSTIGAHVLIKERVFIGQNTLIGDHTLIWEDAYISHDVKVDSYVYIGCRTKIYLQSSIGSHVMIIGNCKILKTNILEHCEIQAGAVLRMSTIGVGSRVGRKSELYNCSLGKHNGFGADCKLCNIHADYCVSIEKEVWMKFPSRLEPRVGTRYFGNFTRIDQGVVFYGSIETKQNSSIGDKSYIGDGVKLGKRVSLGAGVQVDHNVCIGDGAILDPGVIQREDVAPEKHVCPKLIFD